MRNVKAENWLLLLISNAGALVINQLSLAKSTVLQCLPAAVPLPSHLDTQNLTIVVLDNSDNANRNNLSGRKHVHDGVITVFQAKASTIKSKPTISSTDISAIKNVQKLKCQEII